MRVGVAKEYGRRLAAIASLGGIAALHGLTILAACAAVVSGRTVKTVATPPITHVLPAPAIVRKTTVGTPVKKKPPRTRVAQASMAGSLLDWSDEEPGEEARPQRRTSRPARGGTYRTMCVRLCDGYYFPISYATGRHHFAQDASACESRCGGARLFVYRNPGAELEDMADLDGRPYRKLPTAFVYRTKYDAACKCRPHPWEAASLQRHQSYAAAEAATRAGGKTGRQRQAAAMRHADSRSPREQRRSARLSAAAAYDADGSDTDMMRLGRKHGPSVSRPRRERTVAYGASTSDWRKRVFRGY